MCGSGLDPPGDHASCSDGSSLYFWKWLTDVEQCGVVTGHLGARWWRFRACLDRSLQCPCMSNGGADGIYLIGLL